MTETKSMFLSTGMWGGAIALVASVLSILGVADITTEDQTILREHITEIIAAAAALLAMWGRYRAKEMIR